MGTIALIESVADVRNLSTLIFYAILVALTVFVFQRHGQRTFEIIMVLFFLSRIFFGELKECDSFQIKSSKHYSCTVRNSDVTLIL